MSVSDFKTLVIWFFFQPCKNKKFWPDGVAHTRAWKADRQISVGLRPAGLQSKFQDREGCYTEESCLKEKKTNKYIWRSS